MVVRSHIDDMALPPVAILLLPLLLLPGIRTAEYKFVPIEITVMNSVKDGPVQSFDASLVEGGILLGAMTRLMSSNAGFKFSVREDPNFGPFLESVNGLAGSDQEQTYWELLVTKPTGETIRLEVGIGCYLPKAHDKIILNYQKW